jgi:hypothetical protein
MMITKLPWRRESFGVALFLACHVGGSVLAAPLTTGSDTVTIPFSGGVNPITGLLQGSPALNAVFPGGQQDTFIMDTGSAGMVVYNTPFTPAAGATPAYSNVIQAYKSNNLLFQGDVYYTSIEFGTPGNSVTANVPVLFATQQSCAIGNQCSLASSWRFMGVGFGEPPGGNTTWPINSTQRNPLFQITEINGVPAAPTKGWIMASDGITVGLTPANTGGFNPAGLEGLTSSSDGFNRGGAAVFASPTVAGQPPPSPPLGPFSGTVLVDSGVSYAMMVLDPGAPPPLTTTCNSYDGTKVCTDNGYTITVYLGNPSAPTMYQVITGTGGTASASPFDVAAPDFINQLSDTAAFWNTSFYFYNAYNYLFDSESAQVGYRTVSAVPGPLSLTGAAAALGWCHRLRRRVLRARNSSSQP